MDAIGIAPEVVLENSANPHPSDPIQPGNDIIVSLDFSALAPSALKDDPDIIPLIAAPPGQQPLAACSLSTSPNSKSPQKRSSSTPSEGRRKWTVFK